MNENAFKKSSLKRTKNREIILNLMISTTHPLTVNEVKESLKEYKIDLSTIYRTLNSFAKNNILKRELNSNKEYTFLYEENDYHILVCKICHKRISIKGCPYHSVNEKLRKETGFIISDQNTEIYGICPECQKNACK